MAPDTPRWRLEIERALAASPDLPEARFAQLATVRLDGKPANRTVVVRGFLPGQDALQLTTDLRSAKITQIERLPWAELCWFFSQAREQFRLLGEATVVGHKAAGPSLQAARAAVWRTLSPTARAAFTWPLPGAPRLDPGPEAFPLSAPAEPPEAFALLILRPVEVDHLQLQGNPQNRGIHRLDPATGVWQSSSINP